MFLPLRCNLGLCLFPNLNFFSVKLDCVFIRSHNTGLLYVYQLDPIGKQIKGKDIFVRPVFTELLKSKLRLSFLFVLTSRKTEDEFCNI